MAERLGQDIQASIDKRQFGLSAHMADAEYLARQGAQRTANRHSLLSEPLVQFLTVSLAL